MKKYKGLASSPKKINPNFDSKAAAAFNHFNIDYMPQPLISIILCTYNGAQYLEEQFQTIFNQTYTNLEIIVSDDASTDGTVNIIKKYTAQFNIVLHINDKNIGFTKNFEKAATLATGDYIAFADQDDIWCLDKIEKLYAAIGVHSLIYSDSKLIDERGIYLNKNMSDLSKMQNIYHSKGFAFHNPVSGHTMMAKKELLKYALPIPDGHFHDWWVATQAANLNGIIFLNQKLNLYRQHNRSVSRTLYPQQSGSRTISKRYKSFLTELQWLQLLKDSRIEKEKEFYTLFYKLFLLKKRGYFAWPLFWFLLKHKKDIFMFSNKSNLSELIYIRKIARGEKEF